MIDIKVGRITDILPENLASQLEVQAFAYACHRQMVKLCDAADRTRIYAAIQQEPEEILDYLALELRTPCYEMTFQKDIKCRLIAYTLQYYMKMGTPGMVNSVIQDIFGNGRIVEWFDYGGQPHHFRVTGIDPSKIEGHYYTFLALLQEVNRLSAVLDHITTSISTDHRLYTGFAVRLGRKVSVGCAIPSDLDVTYLTDENGDLLADGSWNRIIDDDEEEQHNVSAF